MSKVDSKKICNEILAACERSRGGFDFMKHKDFLLALLLLKAISETWPVEGEVLDEARAKAQTRLVLPVVRFEGLSKDGKGFRSDLFPATFESLYKRRNSDHIAELFELVLTSIEASNAAEMGGIFQYFSFNDGDSLGQGSAINAMLSGMIEVIHLALSTQGSDALSNSKTRFVYARVFDHLLERSVLLAGKTYKGCYTPSGLMALMVRVLKPQAGARICDPNCGHGGLLIEAAKAVGGQNVALFGEEANENRWKLCRMVMFVNGFIDARIEHADSLKAPKLVVDKRLMTFDSVLTNPVFARRDWGAENAKNDPFNRFWRGQPSKNTADWAFITHCLEIADEKKGRIAIVLPHGVLFRSGSEGQIRRQVIEANSLDAVIGLPPKLYTNTSISLVMLVFDRARERGGQRENCRDVLLIDASRDYIAGQKQNTLSPPLVEKIAAAYAARQPIERYARLATIDEVLANDFKLNLPLYVNSHEAEPIDVEAVEGEIADLERELSRLRQEMAKRLDELLKSDG